MSRVKINMDKKELEKLYWERNLSPYKIGHIYGCSFSTITNRFKEFGIPFKNHSLARQKFPKKDFAGTAIEKAYILGFRIGDLNAYKTSNDSEFIVVRCNTTSNDQLDLIKNLFKSYGKVTISNRGNINCHLNKSFNFLLAKYGTFQNIKRRREFFAFTAGYFDAEGYFGINQGKARFKVDSYDAEVLKWISKNFQTYGIRNILRVISVCKTKRNFGKELWRLNVNWAEDIQRLIKNLGPYAKHRKRILQMELCEQNIAERLK